MKAFSFVIGFKEKLIKINLIKYLLLTKRKWGKMPITKKVICLYGNESIAVSLR